MAKTRVQKEEIVKNLTDAFLHMKSVVFANFDKVKVKDADAIRREARLEGVKMIVAKKNLLKIALKNAKLDNLTSGDFDGGVASFVSSEDEIAGAQIIHKFNKNIPGLLMLSGIVGGAFYNKDDIKRLAMLPSRNELLGNVVGTIAAPLNSFVGVLAGTLRSFVTVLGNIEKSKQ